MVLEEYQGLDLGIVGVALTVSLNMQINLITLTRSVAQVEAQLTAVERLEEYRNLPIEEPLQKFQSIYQGKYNKLLRVLFFTSFHPKYVPSLPENTLAR